VRTKWNLTKSEQRTDSTNAKRLRSAGLSIGVEHPASSEAPLLRIEQSEYSFVYAGTALGGMALAICLRLVALKSGITLFDDLVEITITGCDDAEIFVVPPPEKMLSYKVLGWLDIERDAVLNHRIFNGRPLPCGEIFDGILIAQSFARLPSQFQTGMPVSAKIRLTDQWGNVFTSEVRLGLERRKQSLVRPENWPIRAGAGYRQSSSALDQKLTGKEPKPMSGIASVNKKEDPARRSHV
jgi:hypothetical protein